MNDQPLRFIVLRHEGMGDAHFDIMMETQPGSTLATWRSPSWPPKVNERAKRIGEHRREYLQYEGQLTGGRGTVRRVETGTYTKTAAKLGIETYQLSGASVHRLMMRNVGGDDWVMWVPAESKS